LKKQVNPEWEKVAQNIFIPYNESEKHHPTYENAPVEKRGGIVPLMSYPLGFSMSDEVKKNDLSLAISRMAAEGPGAMMTVTFFPIIAAELHNKEWIDDLFPKSYLSFLRPPYNAMAETPNNESTNFLTGAGGFLQQLIFGYSGLRMTQNGLEQKFKPILPSRVRSIRLKNFTVRNKPFDLLIRTEQE
jgi:protein-glucosylgalactosylhydroxylysine glucosidase